jgi:hypothetical protein
VEEKVRRQRRIDMSRCHALQSLADGAIDHERIGCSLDVFSPNDVAVDRFIVPRRGLVHPAKSLRRH